MVARVKGRAAVVCCMMLCAGCAADSAGTTSEAAIGSRADATVATSAVATIPVADASVATSAVASSTTAVGQPVWTYVAFGDSWPYGAHCNGCVPFPQLYKAGLEATTQHTIEFVNRTENGGTSGSLLDSITTSEATRDAVAKADIIVVSTGANDLEAAFNSYSGGTCGGTDALECFREVARGWHDNFAAILTEIQSLRDAQPTAIRIVTNSNEFLFDPGLISLFGADFGPNGGAAITSMHHDELCEVAAEYSAACVDLRPVLNGPNFDRPADINTQESMQAVADALLASGLAELE
jgi:GDSL-like lipase/acylhydrolase family protein